MKLSKTKVIRISETQHKTLKKMKSLNIDVGKFIRIAIKEKIERDCNYLQEPKVTKNDFERQLNKVIEEMFK